VNQTTTSGAGPAIAVEGLVKCYGARRVVDGLSFTVPAGTVFALLGPNGAGKTTTVECLEGFRTPDGGSVRVLGLDPVAGRDRLTPRMGVMLQEGGAYQSATPLEMLRLFTRFYPDPLDPRELLELVGLTASAHARYRSLSGGQKQRLNLALALVGRPEVVLLDEPTAGMDPQARQATWRLIRELRVAGTTALLTTHFMDEAERLADLVAVIDRGRLLALDSPAALVAGAAADHLLVTTPAEVDPRRLAAAVGARVEADGAGRYRVDAGPEAIAAVSAWFAAEGLPLTGVSATEGGLEEVFLRLTGGEVRA
jgi:ABC-2 type transport system ATP-binding protein